MGKKLGNVNGFCRLLWDQLQSQTGPQEPQIIPLSGDGFEIFSSLMTHDHQIILNSFMHWNIFLNILTLPLS